MFLAFAAHSNYKVYQMDVKSAFLNGELEEEVYVEQPPGFEDSKLADFVYFLFKALYGLKQAPRTWYDTLSEFLLENDFTRGVVDKTLFVKKHKNDLILVQVYVDDIIFGSTNDDLCKRFAKLMQSRYEMSMMGELSFFLGLQVYQKQDGIFICQSKYIKDLLKKYQMEDSSTAKTPMPTATKLDKDETGKKVDITGYRAVKRIFRYLKGTPNLGIWYPKDTGFDLIGYTDSDFAGCKIDRKSTSGSCQFLGRRLVSWHSKKQHSVSTSTAEAEYIAAGSCCAQILWMRNQLRDYGLLLTKIPIFCDNTSAIAISNNPVQHSRTKHIDIRKNNYLPGVSTILTEYLRTVPLPLLPPGEQVNQGNIPEPELAPEPQPMDVDPEPSVAIPDQEVANPQPLTTVEEPLEEPNETINEPPSPPIPNIQTSATVDTLFQTSKAPFIDFSDADWATLTKSISEPLAQSGKEELTEATGVPTILRSGSLVEGSKNQESSQTSREGFDLNAQSKGSLSTSPDGTYLDPAGKGSDVGTDRQLGGDESIHIEESTEVKSSQTIGEVSGSLLLIEPVSNPLEIQTLDPLKDISSKDDQQLGLTKDGDLRSPIAPPVTSLRMATVFSSAGTISTKDLSETKTLTPGLSGKGKMIQTPTEMLSVHPEPNQQPDPSATFYNEDNFIEDSSTNGEKVGEGETNEVTNEGWQTTGWGVWDTNEAIPEEHEPYYPEPIEHPILDDDMEEEANSLSLEEEAALEMVKAQAS
ncbi:hypothetical protein POM88_040610 [Heracleum sosnowskyi]|uniref:Reverse transcriptase Ty1/copia-type domain-containing protein n=1 Tax=Heracleum sosnowskyi TaxID=360622 RepID=A0AAD8HD99_9APIA|nr:hypothetical protein POM88_040610 [Heracleum sosnowskyi]